MTTRKGLRFSEPAHRYWLDGKNVRGVTTILQVLNKPAIPRWAAKTVAEYVADNPDGVETLRQMGREPMVNALRGIPWEKRDKAADRGTELHLYAEDLLGGHPIELDDNDPLLPVLENALQFLEDWQIEPILTEAPVASREHWYAGTADLFAEYTHPVTGKRGTGLFDWKSGKGIYPEFAMQLNAYAFAEFAGLDGDEAPVPLVDSAYGVHIRPDGYDVYPFKFGTHIFEEFLAIKAVSEIKTRMDGDWRKPGSGYVGQPITKGETH